MCFYYPEQHLGTTKVATIDWLKDEELESMVDADFPPENEPKQEFSSQTPPGGVVYPHEHVSGVQKTF